MGLSGAGVAGFIGAKWSGSWSGSWPGRAAAAALDPTSEPDLVVFNGTIHTVDPLKPQAQAFAVKAGRFIAVGDSEDIKSLIGKRTETFDARQMTIVPGFIDAHNHAPGAILLYEVLVGNPYQVAFVTIASIIDKLRARARETPPGFWVEGYFFDDTKVQDKRALDIHDLDQASKDHPVAVRHRGGHTSYYNSKAFELAGVSRNTPSSPAGTFDRDADGELNGRVTDRARNAFNNVGMRPSFTADQMLRRNRDALTFISKQFVRYGLTSVHHEGGDLTGLTPPARKPSRGRSRPANSRTSSFSRTILTPSTRRKSRTLKS
jgi:predicted amidohydrolase YtcJ